MKPPPSHFVVVEFPEPGDQIEILSAVLPAFGFEGIEELPHSITGYIPEKQFNEKAFGEYLAQFPALGITFSHRLVPNQNWNEAWEKSYAPVAIAGKVRIRAGFHEADKTFPYELLIDPQMSFGMGHHESTQLMVEMILGMDFRGKSVLDFGSGTGVLSILAHKMQAKSVIAIDNDEWAYNNILENIAKNDAGSILAIRGDAASIPNEKFEIILANVNKNILSENMDSLACSLVKKGTILLSGLLAGDESDMVKIASDNGLILSEKKTKNEWLCLKFVKQ